MKKIAVPFLVLFFCTQVYSQELRCNIQLVTSKIPGTNKQVFQTMQTAITEFMNNTAWTNYKFSNESGLSAIFYST